MFPFCHVVNFLLHNRSEFVVVPTSSNVSNSSTTAHNNGNNNGGYGSMIIWKPNYNFMQYFITLNSNHNTHTKKFSPTSKCFLPIFNFIQC